jgi:hypothetical protein
VGAPATVGREREGKKIGKQDDLRFIWIYHVSSKPLGMSAIQEGAVVAVGE